MSTNATTIREKVGEQIAALSPAVEAKVIEHFVQKEADRRADAIIKGIDKLTELTRERRKTDKGDIVSYNGDGSVATQAYSKDRLEANKKADEQIAKLTKAIDKALEGDASDLFNLTK